MIPVGGAVLFQLCQTMIGESARFIFSSNSSFDTPVNVSPFFSRLFRSRAMSASAVFHALATSAADRTIFLSAISLLLDHGFQTQVTYATNGKVASTCIES